MPKQLRVLNVEDSVDDALLLLRQLERAGYAVTFERVDNAKAMKEALDTREWDVVITDYVLPHFSGPAAVALSRGRRPDLPVVLLSGAVEDELLAAEALTDGAQDYLEKAYLSRVVTAIGLAAGVLSGPERARAHLVLCRQYLEMNGPYQGKALVHGEQAVTAARATDDPSLEASALLWLGTAYLKSRRSHEAIATLQRYEALRVSQGAEPTVPDAEAKSQLGEALRTAGELSAAAVALERAGELYALLGLPSRAAACRQRLASVRKAAGIPALAKTETVKPTSPASVALERARFCLEMEDTARAVQEANEALRLAEGDPVLSHQGYMLLFHCARSEEHLRDALGFALSARIMGLDAHREDLAYRAAHCFMDVLSLAGDRAVALLEETTEHYRQWGVDIRTYLPPGILPSGSAPDDAAN